MAVTPSLHIKVEMCTKCVLDANHKVQILFKVCTEAEKVKRNQCKKK